jgi:hypothetical protein
LATTSDKGRDPRTVIVLLSPITRSPATVNVARPLTSEAVTGVPKNVSGLLSSPEITRFVVSIVTVRAADDVGVTTGLNAVKIALVPAFTTIASVVVCTTARFVRLSWLGHVA